MDPTINGNFSAPEIDHFNDQQANANLQAPEESQTPSAPDDEEEQQKRQIHGLLVRYTDDEINDCVHAALQGKKRVHYKCMDVYSNYVAFGTSVGAIYLFRLTTITHSSCKLVLVVPCDQGSVDVIKFAPGPPHMPNDLLVAIGTSRGSLVLFQVTCLDEQNGVMAHEIYRTEEFTKSSHDSSIGIKLIEFDLIDPFNSADYYQSQANLAGPGGGGQGVPSSFSKVYICDQKDRIFVLESSSIFPAFRLLYSHKPAHVLSVDESNVHQVDVHRSQLLLSTDEKTRIFSEHSNELATIGKKQRKQRGFFGACFFNPNYKPARMATPSMLRDAGTRQGFAGSQQTMYSSTNSIAELDSSMLIFIARPKFSLWQVNNRLEVMFTHIFESAIRESVAPFRLVELLNEPIKQLAEDKDSSQQVNQIFASKTETTKQEQPKSDHFERLMPIFSTTLGNLLLSHTRHEIFVIDPIGARLIIWYHHERPITQVCCNENEIFVLSEVSRRQFQVDRLILLAPTQFILELHRLNRFLSLITFTQLFSTQFRHLMALPLSGPATITTEGGLLRNIMWNTWREANGSAESEPVGDNFAIFKQLVEEIIDESKQFKQSMENLADSRLLFLMSTENIERLCSEPYASMVSLDISIANLHTNHVVHFSREALERHKSLAKLSHSILNLSKLKRAATQSSLVNGDVEEAAEQLRASHLELTRAARDKSPAGAADHLAPVVNFTDKSVIVERMPIKQSIPKQTPDASTKVVNSKISELQEEATREDSQEKATNEQQQQQQVPDYDIELESSVTSEEQPIVESVDEVDMTRCANCEWPKPRAHLKPMHHSQQIQYNYIQENLMPNFEENIEPIEERSFKHGLWHLVLKCLAFRNQLDDYITCCIMLDDVRLLNIERFVITRCSEDDLIDRVFEQLSQKLDMDGEHETQAGGKMICFKCKNELQAVSPDNVGGDDDDEDDDDDNYSQTDDINEDNDDDDDDISFNLVNLFRKFMLRKNADIRKAVHRLLEHPNLLNRSRIRADFYLQAIAGQCAALRRTRFKV